MISEFLPSAFGVRVGLAVFDGKGSIEEEDSLFCPFGKITVIGHFKDDFFIAGEIFVDVFERWWWGDWLENTKA